METALYVSYDLVVADIYTTAHASQIGVILVNWSCCNMSFNANIKGSRMILRIGIGYVDKVWCIHIHIHMYANTYVYVSTHVYVCVCIYTHR